MKKTKKNLKTLGVWVGGATAANLIAPKMPGTSGVPLQKVGTGMAKMTGPMTTVMGAGMVVDQLKHLPKIKKRKSVRR